MINKLKTTKAYFEGWKIAVDDGRSFLAEYSHELKIWNLFELDSEGDVYGHKEWTNAYDRLKYAKDAIRFGELSIA